MNAIISRILGPLIGGAVVALLAVLHIVPTNDEKDFLVKVVLGVVGLIISGVSHKAIDKRVNPLDSAVNVDTVTEERMGIRR